MSKREASEKSRRSAGILLHVTSLPGGHGVGVGDLGPAAHGWVDALAGAKQTWWQILPTVPPADGASPYFGLSAFAGNPLLISADELVRDGLLQRSDIAPQRFPADRVVYERVEPYKRKLLARAWERFNGGAARSLRTPFEAFRRKHPGWLDDFALFMALKETYPPDRSWVDWPKDLVLREPAALAAARRELAGAIARQQFTQFLFFRQWEALRVHARRAGVKLIGDLPIFVSGESADVWSNPHLFQLDARRRPRAVAGVPPDYFSKTGQRWGNPLYDWRALRRDGFRWWIARARATLDLVDLVRLDHFRGFAAYWAVPAGARTAIAGRWVKAPGKELFEAIRGALGGLPFIAEDLGLITPDVESLRDAFALPGMRILQFAFGGDPADRFLPHNYDRNAVVYTGTHDNDATVGWYRSLTIRQRALVDRYALGMPRDGAWPLIRMAWESVADLAIVPMQDVLGLGSASRMNTPGTADDNWRWRLAPGAKTQRALARLADLTTQYGRAAGSGS